MRSNRWEWMALSVCLVALVACKEDDATPSNMADGGTPCSSSSAGSSGAAAAEMDAPLVGTAIALIAPFGDGTVTGSATFLQSDEGISLVVALGNCPDGAHAVHIHEGLSCVDAGSQGEHWDMKRGEGIPDVMCSDNMGSSKTMRLPDDPHAWTIGGPAKTNMVGRVVVVHGEGDPTSRIGCGPIMVR